MSDPNIPFTGWSDPTYTGVPMDFINRSFDVPLDVNEQAYLDTILAGGRGFMDEKALRWHLAVSWTLSRRIWELEQRHDDQLGTKSPGNDTSNKVGIDGPSEGVQENPNAVGAPPFRGSIEAQQHATSEGHQVLATGISRDPILEGMTMGELRMKINEVYGAIVSDDTQTGNIKPGDSSIASVDNEGDKVGPAESHKHYNHQLPVSQTPHIGQHPSELREAPKSAGATLKPRGQLKRRVVDGGDWELRPKEVLSGEMVEVESRLGIAQMPKEAFDRNREILAVESQVIRSYLPPGVTSLQGLIQELKTALGKKKLEEKPVESVSSLEASPVTEYRLGRLENRCRGMQLESAEGTVIGKTSTLEREIKVRDMTPPKPDTRSIKQAPQLVKQHLPFRYIHRDHRIDALKIWRLDRFSEFLAQRHKMKDLSDDHIFRLAKALYKYRLDCMEDLQAVLQTKCEISNADSLIANMHCLRAEGKLLNQDDRRKNLGGLRREDSRKLIASVLHL
ncbi:hypothetical protein FN846DRAFT_632973 [Sphaerosporella brunnea]|uniref:Uncharacterized protein n=1 Tax=Sphaerosporella brunnea TaxID=1250544 RepID=A0A5J5EZY1_9PEZI|nr:hypothetical protein FN846DRAFT_632973 [Sphaerosporella brunnea]